MHDPKGTEKSRAVEAVWRKAPERPPKVAKKRTLSGSMLAAATAAIAPVPIEATNGGETVQRMAKQPRTIVVAR